jgi:hypothetical protein
MTISPAETARLAKQAADNQHRTEDLLWMLATGENLQGAADRLGIKPDSLTEWCKDNGLAAEAVILRSRDPQPIVGDRSETARRNAEARWAS